MKATLSILFGLMIATTSGLEATSTKLEKLSKASSQRKLDKTEVGLSVFQRAEGRRTIERIFQKALKPSDFHQAQAKGKQLKASFGKMGVDGLNGRRFEFSDFPGKKFELSKDGQVLRGQGAHFQLQEQKSFLANYRKIKNQLKAHRQQKTSWLQWLLPSANAQLTVTNRPDEVQTENEDYLAYNVTTLLYYMSVWHIGDGEVDWVALSEEPAVQAARASVLADERQIQSLSCYGEFQNLSLELSDGSTSNFAWLQDRHRGITGLKLSQKSGARAGAERNWPISGPTSTLLEGTARNNVADAIFYYCSLLQSDEQRADIVARMNEALDPTNEHPFLRARDYIHYDLDEDLPDGTVIPGDDRTDPDEAN